MSESKYAWIGVAPCNCVRTFIVEPELPGDLKERTDWVRRGYQVLRVPVAEARERLTKRCDYHRPERKEEKP